MSKEAVSVLENLSVDVLDPDPRNAKEHTPLQIEQITMSIQDYGFNDPLGVMQLPNGRYMVVEGHGRLEAAKSMGLETVPCLILPHMTEAERKAYAIAHNQIQTITGLDMQVVSDEFSRLGVEDTDYMSLGFTQEDVLFLLPEPSDEPTPQSEMADITEEDGGEAGYNAESWKGYIPPVYKSNLRFNSEGDKLAFYQFVNVLRGRYLTAATIAERFILFIEEFGGMEDTVGDEGDA